MSSEYKDWINDTTSENRILIKKFPYLLPDNYKGHLDKFNYTFTKLDEMPSGWRDITLDAFKEINEILFNTGTADIFNILQIKEKHYMPRIYYYFGDDELGEIPKNLSQNVTRAEAGIEVVLKDLERKSAFVCMNCGAPIEKGKHTCKKCGGIY